MYVTALLMILVAIGMVLPKSKSALVPFNQENTLPLRGLLALLIVLHHLGTETHLPIISSYRTGIGFPIVAVFFFISGYGLCVSFKRKGRLYLDGFLNKRLGKLLPVFLFLTLSLMAFYHFGGYSSFTDQFTKLINRGITPLPFSWFIYTIFYSYIAFYFSALIGKTPQKTGVLFLISTIIYVVFMAIIAGFAEYWWWTIGSINLGYYVALYENQIEKLITNHRIPFYTALVSVLFLSFCAVAKIHTIENTCTMSWIFIQAFAVYVVIRTFGMVKWKSLIFVGTFSLELYLVHGIPLYFGQAMRMDDWMLWIFTYATAIPIAYLLNRYFKLPKLPKFLNSRINSTKN